MQSKKLFLVYTIMVLLLASISSLPASSQQNPPLHWNSDWSYYQEIKLPIETDNLFAIYQPIDILITFNHPCWVKNESAHSIRVCCWDGSVWHELESQIYALEFKDDNHISKCGVIFLIPSFAYGGERYFIYYDGKQKPPPAYPDHVDIEDSYYYYEPIEGVSVEGDYYKIIENDYCIYGVGQKGKIINRQFSQAIVKTKPEVTEFNMIDSQVATSFSFAFNEGTSEEDEISSDEILISKEIRVDGNLMVEFAIASESSEKQLRTKNIYKYYYCPNKNKRICVNVKHNVVEHCKVSGIENIDGRYGAMGTLKSRSAIIPQMRFGEILPYLHIFGEDGNIKEYRMNLNPESTKREWVISYKDDCDLGKDAWLSLDEGVKGKVHALLFSSNKDVVKYGTNERDGIQVQVGEREYLNLIETEIDYAAVNFGRNSFEKDVSHDLDIPNDLVIEFDAEVFTMEDGDFKDVIEEGKIYRTLVRHRYKDVDDGFEGDQTIHTLTVVTGLTGRLSYPSLKNMAPLLPVTWVELYQNDTLISSGIVNKTFFGPPKIKFPKLASGEYIVKVYRKAGNRSRYIGIESVNIEGDTTLHILCTWQKTIEVVTYNQYGEGIKDIEIILMKNNTVVGQNITDNNGIAQLNAPINFIELYNLYAFYKGFIIYNEESPMMQKHVDINLDLYDLYVDIRDDLNLSPGVDVKLVLTSSAMIRPEEILATNIEPGIHLFNNLLPGPYELQISYGGFIDRKTIQIPEINNSTSMRFTVLFDLSVSLFDSRGTRIYNGNQKIDIIRNEQTIYDSISYNEIVTIPPGSYTINVYSEEKLVAIKNLELTNNKNVRIVTILESIFPLLITVIGLIILAELSILFIFKKISLNSYLKLIAMILIIISLFQPWWILHASSNNPVSEKDTEMFLHPQTMIERTTLENVPYLDLATIPVLFTNFLGILFLVVCSGFILLGISFIPNIVLKRRFSLILVIASILFLILVAIAFSFGMSKITEISLGSLQGSGMIDVVLPNGEPAVMSSYWGFGNGFYLCIIAAVITISAGILDFYIKYKKNVNF